MPSRPTAMCSRDMVPNAAANDSAIIPIVRALSAVGIATHAASSGEGTDHAFIELTVDGLDQLGRFVRALDATSSEAEGVGLFLDVSLDWRAQRDAAPSRIMLTLTIDSALRAGPTAAQLRVLARAFAAAATPR